MITFKLIIFMFLLLPLLGLFGCGSQIANALNKNNSSSPLCSDYCNSALQKTQVCFPTLAAGFNLGSCEAAALTQGYTSTACANASANVKVISCNDFRIILQQGLGS